MIDVHPPHEPMHGWRDFLLHLTTITIGLLIALSLEGLVEWHEHRRLVREAEASLHAEIQVNANRMPGILADLHKQQDELKNDVPVLEYIMKNHKAPEHSSMGVHFSARSFADEGWKTAQSTNALSYMPYARAQEYAYLYGNQADFVVAQQQAIRDAILCITPLANIHGDPNDPNLDPTGGQAGSMKDKIEVLQGQLFLVEEMASGLNSGYKQFLAAHPN